MVTVTTATGVVRSFELSKYELTFAQWDVCAQYGPCRQVSDEGWGRSDRPVINVSWFDAQQFVAWLSQETGEVYRLPSYAEWVQNCYNDPVDWPFERGGPIPVGSSRERTDCDGRIYIGGGLHSLSLLTFVLTAYGKSGLEIPIATSPVSGSAWLATSPDDPKRRPAGSCLVGQHSPLEPPKEVKV